MRALSATGSKRTPHAAAVRRPAARARSSLQQQHWRRRSRQAARAGQQPDSVLPEDVDLNDPELQAQIDALLRELDPDLLLEDTNVLVDEASIAAAAALQADQAQAQAQAQQQPAAMQQQQAQQWPPGGSYSQADAWRDEPGDEETEAGLPAHIMLTRAEYKRKAAVLVELLAALQSEAAEEAVLERLAAFRVEIDEPLLHMLAKRLEAAQQHEQDPEGVDRMQQLQALLQLEYERAQATPSLRLLDELLELLGDDPALPGARQRAQQVVARMRAAFTGGAPGGLDIFAAAAALAADKAVAADALAVEFVPQPVFVAESLELLQQAKQEMEALSAAVTEAQAELQRARNRDPQLLASPQAQQHMQQVAHADEVLQRRKAAVVQLAYVLELAQDLEAAERRLAAPTEPDDLAAALGVQ